jgi:hypothetical protein
VRDGLRVSGTGNPLSERKGLCMLGGGVHVSGRRVRASREGVGVGIPGMSRAPAVLCWVSVSGAGVGRNPISQLGRGAKGLATRKKIAPLSHIWDERGVVAVLKKKKNTASITDMVRSPRCGASRGTLSSFITLAAKLAACTRARSGALVGAIRPYYYGWLRPCAGPAPRCRPSPIHGNTLR